MGTHVINPLITVHPDTKKRLDELGKKGQTYNDIIVKLLNANEGKKEGSGVTPDISKEFSIEKKICHGKPMRKVELLPGKFGYKCDECLTLMVKE